MTRGTTSDAARWNQRYTERPWPTDPSPWLVENASLLATNGRALDVAGGTGRNAIWLAAQGWEVTIVDVSAVALDLARTRARSSDVTLHTLETDITDGHLPTGGWDAIMVFHYLDRDLFPSFPALLNPGGIVIGSLATVRNLERNERPPLPHLLEEGELATLVEGLEMVSYDESWDDGNHDARFVARAKERAPRMSGERGLAT